MQDLILCHPPKRLTGIGVAALQRQRGNKCKTEAANRGSALARQESACQRQAWSPVGEENPQSVIRAQIATEVLQRTEVREANQSRVYDSPMLGEYKEV